jgi:site-specific recombinase XerD
MAIEKRSLSNGNTAYRAVVTKRIDGKRHRMISSFKTKREARAWEIEQLENLRGGLNIAETRVNFRSLADKWLNEVIMHEKSHNTFRAFKGDLVVHIYPILGALKISKITKNHVSTMRAMLSEKQLSRASINRIMASFKSFINYCIDHGHIVKNPFVGYKELKIQKKQKEFWEKEDLQNFVKNAKGNYYYDLFIFALNTGVRIGEIGALNVGKVNLERNTILIDESIGKAGISSVKNYEIRNIYMNETVRKIVKTHIKDKGPKAPLFSTKENARVYSGSFTVRNFTPLQQRLKLNTKISFHGLRHTFASHFLMNGGSIFDLQKLLGHKSINSTMVYAHLSQSHIQDIMGKMKFE